MAKPRMIPGKTECEKGLAPPPACHSLCYFPVPTLQKIPRPRSCLWAQGSSCVVYTEHAQRKQLSKARRGLWERTRNVPEQTTPSITVPIGCGSQPALPAGNWPRSSMELTIFLAGSLQTFVSLVSSEPGLTDPCCDLDHCVHQRVSEAGVSTRSGLRFWP